MHAHLRLSLISEWWEEPALINQVSVAVTSCSASMVASLAAGAAAAAAAVQAAATLTSVVQHFCGIAVQAVREVNS
jgi:hypothetical protein